MPSTSGSNTTVLPFPTLIADIGGTNARFAIIVDAFAEPKVFASIRTRDFATLDEAIQTHVLDQTSVMPRGAVLAVAGPTDGEEIDLTNCDWVVRPRGMIADLGFDEVVILNDYEAQALAVVALEEDNLEQIGGGVRDPASNRVVIGPGTGLGVAGLVHAARTWIPVAGEGGHVDLGPQTDRDLEVFAHIKRIGGRVSGEQVLCGSGMVNLYGAVCRANGAPPTLDTPAAITAAARDGSDAAAVETLSLFAEYLGRVAGDLALIFMARGGVYLTGGITQKILPFFDRARFRAGFENKAPHQAMIAAMPTYAITHDRAPMEGLAAYARTPSRFGVSLEGRHWKR
ncbi:MULTISPECIES: glucokinase [unclassified Roseitalea]|uniref:glucokinase n=1 Tax=unclassified Roseitalea TaxID=2639107 RepID=UPI00273D2767|nr:MULTISPECIES: glucokinase [unclassified Roseitalea]